jgi:hypothetical protein
LPKLCDVKEFLQHPRTSPECGAGALPIAVGGWSATPFNFSAMLDPENWKIVFQVYKGRSISALALAYQLIAIKQSLQRGRNGIPDAIAGLDLAIHALFPHTDFHRVGHKFFLRTIEGNLTSKQEERLRELGIKF